MSILNFSDTLMCISVAESTNDIHLGSFTTDSTDGQVEYIRVLMYFDGQFTNETINLLIQDTRLTPSTTWTSDTVLITDIDTVLSTDSNWLGWVRFDFDKQHILASTEYHLMMSAANYTETASLSINMVWDFPIPMNGTRQTWFSDHPIAFEVYRLER